MRLLATTAAFTTHPDDGRYLATIIDDAQVYDLYERSPLQGYDHAFVARYSDHELGSVMLLASTLDIIGDTGHAKKYALARDLAKHL